MIIDGSTGDPASLRFTAARIRSSADEVCALADDIRVRLGRLVYEGAAADRFHAAVDQAYSRIHAQAGEMGAQARILEARAQDVEQAIALGGTP